MRCGPGTVTLKLNLPALSALVVPPTSMPLARLMRSTSSPAAGLLVVPLVTVPVRVWAAARVSERTANRSAEYASLQFYLRRMFFLYVLIRQDVISLLYMDS